MLMDQIKIKKLAPKDLQVIARALEYYLQLLQMLLHSENTAQQNIHCSIVVQFGDTVRQKLNKRNIPESNSLKVEVYTAFVLKDALVYYVANPASSDYEKAIARRIFSYIGSMLPAHSDSTEPALQSKI